MNLKGSSPKTSDSHIKCQSQNLLKSVKQMSDPSMRSYAHYYRIGLCSRSFVPVTFGPGTKGGFCPGSKGAGGTGAFCPGWSHQPGQKAPLLSRLVAPPGTKGPTLFIPVGNTNPDKRVTLLSRLVVPTGTKGPFCPGWSHQPGQKAPPRDSSKGSYSLLSHMYYLDELASRPCARQ